MSQPNSIVADGSKVLLGRGAVYLDRLTSAGVKTGERFLGNCSKFEVSGSEETKDLRGMVDSSNPLIARVTVSRTLELSIAMNEFEKNNLALALMGDTGYYPAQSAASLTDEIITPAGGSVAGNWYKASKRNFTSMTLKDDDVSAAQGAADVNWTPDLTVGRIRVTPGGSIVDGSVLKLSGAYAQITATGLELVTPVTAGIIKGLVRFVGDPMNGKVIECEIPLVQISPDGAVALIGDDYADYSLKGTILSDAVNNPTFPFGRWFVR